MFIYHYIPWDILVTSSKYVADKPETYLVMSAEIASLVALVLLKVCPCSGTSLYSASSCIDYTVNLAKPFRHHRATN